MTTVRETLDLPDGSSPSMVQVEVTLVGEGGEAIGAAYAPDSTVVSSVWVRPDDDGLWEIELVPNADIVPSGTVYRLRLNGSRVDKTARYIQVPSTPDPADVEGLLTDPPGAIDPSGLAAHMAATTSVHGIADTAALLTDGDVGTEVQAHSSVLDSTSAAFTVPQEAKLAGVEADADVTDAANVEAAGALMSSADLADLDSASTARDNLGVVASVQAGDGLDVDTSDPRSPVVSMVAPVLTGTGFPEGSVSAPVGTTYIDTDATNGAVKWLKVEGSGSSGWRVEYGDTDWRDVSGDLLNGWTGDLFLRRNGDVVELRGAIIGDGTSNVAWEAPDGVRPESVGGTRVGTAASTSSSGPLEGEVGMFGGANRFLRAHLDSDDGLDHVFGMMWIAETSPPWPTVEPGVPS